MLSVSREAVNTNFKVIGLTRLGIKPKSTAQEIDALYHSAIKWKFNIPFASHHEGAWERQIRSIKKVLAGVCSEQLLTNEALSTVLCEVECILHSRPLTTVLNDPQDLEPLTSNHLLLMKNDYMLPPGLFNCNDLSSRKGWRQVQYLVNLF